MASINNKRSISAIVGISVASVLLVLSFCGRYMDYGVARSIFNFFVGSFGMSFYGIMIAVISACAMVLSGRDIVLPARHIVNFVLSFIIIVLIVHTYSSIFLFELTFDSYISTCYNYYVLPTFGGVVWGSISYSLVSVMTIWGASVLLFVALAINLIFVVNFCYDLATHKIILDRRVANNVSTVRDNINTPIAEPVVDDSESARNKAISILFANTNDSSTVSPQKFDHAPNSRVDNILNTNNTFDNSTVNDSKFNFNNNTTNATTEPDSTINIDAFFGKSDVDESDFIVPSLNKETTVEVNNKPIDNIENFAPVEPANHVDASVLEQTTAQKLEEIASKLQSNGNDISVAEIAVERTITDTAVSNEPIVYDIAPLAPTQPTPIEDILSSSEQEEGPDKPIDNSQYMQDNDIDMDIETYTGEVVNDVVEKSAQSQSFGIGKQYTITEVQQPVQGGVQIGFDIEDSAKLKEKQSSVHKYAKYDRPPIELLDDIVISRDEDVAYRQQSANAIVAKLAVYNIDTEIADIIVGPTVTQYRLKVLSQKTRMNNFVNYADDLKSCLASADDIRIEAPIPGTPYVGVEVANNTRTTVKLRSMLESDAFNNRKAKLNFAIGQDISGHHICYDLTEMPHLLIAGTTGSGKSVVLNNLIVSMMYKYSPEYLRFIMVDPKFVELSRYNGCPHLLTSEAITVVKDALASMDYLISEMESRFQLFRSQGASNIAEYNTKINPTLVQKLPYIVLVVDELADLMSSNKKAFEGKILRLAQKSRACGIHIVLATQRPSVDIVTGTIKSNLPARMALKVATAVDSKTILGFGGAENLLGKGDMLFVNGASSATTRVQGAYIDNEEIAKVVEYTKSQNEVYFPEDAYKNIFVSQQVEEEVEVVVTKDKKTEVDKLCKKALYIWLCDKGIASISSIQRKMAIGFNRAGRIVETLEEMGYIESISDSETNSKRRVLVTLDQLDDLFPDQSID